MPTDKLDLVVIGAGPAGCAAAITAARAGLTTVMIDRADFPRDKCCGDGLTALALSELERLGFDPRGLSSGIEVAEAMLRSPSGRTVQLPLRRKSPLAAVAKREEFDADLVRLAEQAGASVQLANGVVGARLDAWGRCEVTLADGARRRAPFVVAADGIYSPTRRMLGLRNEPYTGDWHAIRQYRSATGAAASQMWVWFERDLLPGYAWSFPLSDGPHGERRVNFGFGVPRNERRPNRQRGRQRANPLGEQLNDHESRTTGQQLADIWQQLAQRPHIAQVLGDSEPLDAHRAWPIPTRLGRLPLATGGVMFCGDAAAAADALTGEGIGQALVTGRLAATCAIDATARGLSAPDAGALYRRRVEAALGADHRLSHRLGALMRHPVAARVAVRAVDASAWTRRRFAEWLFEAYPRAIATTPSRWSLKPARAHADVGPPPRRAHGRNGRAG